MHALNITLKNLVVTVNNNVMQLYNLAKAHLTFYNFINSISSRWDFRAYAGNLICMCLWVCVC